MQEFAENSARFKEMERWMDRNVTGEASLVKARQKMAPPVAQLSDSEEPTEFGVVWERFDQQASPKRT
jgi:hypothetical protein